MLWIFMNFLMTPPMHGFQNSLHQNNIFLSHLAMYQQWHNCTWAGKTQIGKSVPQHTVFVVVLVVSLSRHALTLRETVCIVKAPQHWKPSWPRLAKKEATKQVTKALRGVWRAQPAGSDPQVVHTVGLLCSPALPTDYSCWPCFSSCWLGSQQWAVTYISAV